jgi:hypothetical protein
VKRPHGTVAQSLWVAIWAGVALLGCSGESSGGVETNEGPRTPAPELMPGLGFVASTFGFHYPDDPEAGLDGFDLDGRTSSIASPLPDECAHDDFMSPAGEPGIDYNFLRLINDSRTREDGKFIFGGFRQGQIVDGVISGASKNGSMTILLQIQGVDDRQNDEQVSVQIFASEDAPALGTDNSVLQGATLSIHSDDRYHSGEVPGSIADGVLTAGPIDLLFPIDIMIVSDEFLIHDAWLRLELRDGTFAGTVSGYWDVADVRRIIGVPTTDNGNAANFTIEQFDAAMLQYADGDYDPDSGVCDSLSVMFQFAGVQAFLVDTDGYPGSGGTGGEGGSNGGREGPMPVDQCVNDADQAALEAIGGPGVVGEAAGECPFDACGAEVAAVLGDSSETARNALGDCVAQCISDATGLSPQCTACYGSITACSTAFCIAPCALDPGSAECADCALENCIDVNACTGFY